jgi:hypothetical protein
MVDNQLHFEFYLNDRYLQNLLIMILGDRSDTHRPHEKTLGVKIYSIPDVFIRARNDPEKRILPYKYSLYEMS